MTKLDLLILYKGTFTKYFIVKNSLSKLDPLDVQCSKQDKLSCERLRTSQTTIHRSNTKFNQ